MHLLGLHASKTLLRPGEALAAARVPGAREAVTGALDVSAALAFRDWITACWDDGGQVSWLKRKGIDLIRGTGRIAGPGRGGGRRRDPRGRPHRAGDRVVADRPPGPRPAGPARPLDQPRDHPDDREPRRLLVLGGGAVGGEMAQATARLGAEAALDEGAPHVLAHEPAELGEALGEALRADGVELPPGEHSTGARMADGGYALAFADGSELRGDKLLVATGRAPRTEGIGLESVGIAPDPHGVAVDERMRVTDGVWAVGDVTGVLMFTHVGKYQGRIAAARAGDGGDPRRGPP